MARIVLLGPLTDPQRAWHSWVAETLLADGHTLTLGGITPDDLSHFGALRLVLRQPGSAPPHQVQVAAAAQLERDDHDISITLSPLTSASAPPRYPLEAPVFHAHLTVLFGPPDPEPTTLLQALDSLNHHFLASSHAGAAATHVATSQSTLLLEGDLSQLATWTAPALQALVNIRAKQMLLRVSPGRYLQTFIATRPVKNAIRPPSGDTLRATLLGSGPPP